MHRPMALFFCLGILTITAGCDQNVANDADPPPAVEEQEGEEAEIVFHFFYRTSIFTADSEAQQLTITIPLMEGAIPEIPMNLTQSVEFEDLNCVATAYYNSLSLSIHDTATGNPVTNVLYQFDSVPDNRLTTHGFTGLHYVYHPESQSELQFWATVNETASAEQTTNPQ